MTESGIRNSRVFSVLLTSCGIETLSWTQMVVIETGLTFISLLKKDTLKYIFSFKKLMDILKYISTEVQYQLLLIPFCSRIYLRKGSSVKSFPSSYMPSSVQFSFPEGNTFFTYISGYMCISRLFYVCIDNYKYAFLKKSFIIANLKHI